MNIAICDDNQNCRQEIVAAVNEYLSTSDNKAIHVEVFEHAEDVVEAANKKGGFDIYILDVIMPDTDGIMLGESLRKGGYDGKIIYLTSSEEFAVHSYKVKAFDYLLKPIDKEKLFACLNDAISALWEKSKKSIMVKTKESTIKLNFESIMFVELSRRTLCYTLTSGKKVESTHLRSTFAEAIKELLEDARFCLCGAGMAINLYNIIEVSNDYVTMKSGDRISFGRKAIREIRSAWCEFCLNEVKYI